MTSIETYIKNGLPVRATGNVRAGDGVEDMEFTFMNGHPVLFKVSKEDTDRVEQELIDAYWRRS